MLWPGRYSLGFDIVCDSAAIRIGAHGINLVALVFVLSK
jgi:hypothetical protein